MKCISWLLAAFVASAPLAGAAQRNTGGDAPKPNDRNILTPKNKMKLGAPVNILYAPSEADDPAYRSAIAAITGGTVDYFDGVNGTPSVALMQNYDCVYTWANFAYQDNVTFGNNLATFVDGGGRAVLGAFCTFTSGNSMGGAIMTAALLGQRYDLHPHHRACDQLRLHLPRRPGHPGRGHRGRQLPGRRDRPCLQGERCGRRLQQR
jgi:hypothetical protein